MTGSGTEPRALVAGVDSSTQATKVVVCDAATGEVLREARAPHPDGTEIDPEQWWQALGRATGDGILDGVTALAVGGQQHGMVALAEDGSVVRPALLWNDVRSAEAATALVEEVGAAAWAEAVGSVPVAALTVSKLRWLAEHEPEHAARVAEVVLPHDWVTARLLDAPHGSADEGLVPPGTASTDRGDASGTGYWSPGTGEYRTDLLERSFGRVVGTPRVLGPADAAGETPDGVLLAAGTGDNMAAALGLGLGEGDVVVSLGTSGTAFATTGAPTADATGAVCGFADAAGGFLPLVCTLNAARVLTAAASMLGVDLATLEELALAAPSGSSGLVLLPYLDAERTPDLPDATGTIGGLTRANATAENLARAAHEGMLCGLADGVDALLAHGVEVGRVLLTGGAARSAAVREVAREVFGVPLVVPEPGEYVAVGAARQAAWAAVTAGGGATPSPPTWARHADTVLEPTSSERGVELRAAYRDLRVVVHPQTA